MNRFLSRQTTQEVIQRIREGSFLHRYDYEKHRLVLLDAQQNELVYLRLPLNLPALNQALHIPEKPVHYIMLLIQSGSCAMGYFENGLNVNHKVFRAYMVRKKQGTSQIKFLKTKGKSRAGSRVRLAETNEFFENINERLQEYFRQHEVHRIALSCSKILIPYLFNSKVTTPFDKRDERIFKIPKHVPTPIYEVMMDTHQFLLKGELIYEEAQQPLIDQLLGTMLQND